MPNDPPYPYLTAHVVTHWNILLSFQIITSHELLNKTNSLIVVVDTGYFLTSPFTFIVLNVIVIKIFVGL